MNNPLLKQLNDFDDVLKKADNMIKISKYIIFLPILAVIITAILNMLTFPMGVLATVSIILCLIGRERLKKHKLNIEKHKLRTIEYCKKNNIKV